MNIAIDVAGQVLTAAPAAILVSQSVGVVTFSCTFDDSWAGLTKKVVFKNGCAKKELIYTDGQALVPWEVLQCDGYLWISVVGYADGEQQPTAEMDIPLPVGRCGAIQGDSPQDYTPPLWQQVSNQVTRLGQKMDAFLPTGNGEQGQTLFAGQNGENTWAWPGIRTLESVCSYQLSSPGALMPSILYTITLPGEDGEGGTPGGVYVQSPEHIGLRPYWRIARSDGTILVSQVLSGFDVVSILADHDLVTFQGMYLYGQSYTQSYDANSGTWVDDPRYAFPWPSYSGNQDGHVLGVNGNAWAIMPIPKELPETAAEPGQALFATADGNIWDWPGVRTFESVMDYQLSSGAGAAILYTYVLPDGDGNGGSGNGIYVQASAHFGVNWYLRIVDQDGNRIINQQPFYSAMAMRINASSSSAVITIIQFSGLSEVYDLAVSAKTLTKRPNIGIPTPNATGADDGKILAVANNAYALAKPPSDLPTPTEADAGKVPTVNADGTGYGLKSVGENWETLAQVALEETAVPILDIGDVVSNFKSIRFYAKVPQVETQIANVAIAAAVYNSTTGPAYNMANTTFGYTTGESFVFMQFEPLICEGICKSDVVKSTIVGLNPSVSGTYQYNSYDYSRLLSARYVRTSQLLPVGTTITITGVRK